MAGPQIYEFKGAIATIKRGQGRIINGTFNLVHVINLENYDEALKQIIPLVEKVNSTNLMKPQLEFQINQIMESLKKLRGTSSRMQKRSINWIGSAWKWLAGSPDATDWDNILKSQNELIDNNNRQYKINREVMKVTNEVIGNYNLILKEIKGMDQHLEQITFNKLGIIKEPLNEIVLAAEIAKRGIVNTNLLSRAEIQKILKETEVLPYFSEIEAIEYAQPKVVTNGQTILYVLSLPKTCNQQYDHVLARSTIKDSKQVHLEYEELFIKDNIYGLQGKCDTMNNVTICNRSKLKKLDKEHCIFQLLKGKNAKCDFIFNKEEIIEAIDDNTIFLSNFNGEVTSGNNSRHLIGSFIIQHNNVTVQVKGQTFINKVVTIPQVLPAIFQTNLTEANIKLNLDYIHDLHLNNTHHIQNLFSNDSISLTTDIIILLTIIIFIMVILKYVRRTTIDPATEQSASKVKPTESSFTQPLDFKIDLRDADL